MSWQLSGSSISILVLGSWMLVSAPAQALLFTHAFDNSSSAPLLSQAEQAVAAAETTVSGLFSNPVTLNFQYRTPAAPGNVADAAFNQADFPSPFGSRNVSYDQIRAILIAHSLLHPENA